jgi:hypothetical protein
MAIQAIKKDQLGNVKEKMTATNKPINTRKISLFFLTFYSLFLRVKRLSSGRRAGWEGAFPLSPPVGGPFQPTIQKQRRN